MQKRHPNRWVGRGVVQVQAQELFTMMQLILEDKAMKRLNYAAFAAG
jgi:hypothetical protein